MKTLTDFCKKVETSVYPRLLIETICARIECISHALLP